MRSPAICLVFEPEYVLAAGKTIALCLLQQAVHLVPGKGSWGNCLLPLLCE